MVLIEGSEVADARMRIFNKDGSEGAMAGNSIRCVAKYLYDKGIARKEREAGRCHHASMIASFADGFPVRYGMGSVNPPLTMISKCR